MLAGGDGDFAGEVGGIAAEFYMEPARGVEQDAHRQPGDDVSAAVVCSADFHFHGQEGEGLLVGVLIFFGEAFGEHNGDFGCLGRSAGLGHGGLLLWGSEGEFVFDEHITHRVVQFWPATEARSPILGTRVVPNPFFEQRQQLVVWIHVDIAVVRIPRIAKGAVQIVIALFCPQMASPECAHIERRPAILGINREVRFMVLGQCIIFIAGRVQPSLDAKSVLDFSRF